MKKIILFAALLVAAKAYSQCGVYLTASDYINGKLTDECKKISIPSGPGPDDRVALLGKRSYLWTEIWGYKDGMSEYRILYGQPMLIACKGAIYVFTYYGPIKKGKKGITY